MRTLLPFIFVSALASAACGSRPPAKAPDPTDTPPSGDEPTKWDSSSTTGKEPSNAAPTGTGTGTSTKPVDGPKQRTDQYDKEQTEIVLKRASRQVKDNCGATKDDTGKASGPWGKVTIQVLLGHNGHGQPASIPDPYKGKATGNCVERAFSGLTFPPWGGSDTTIDWEVELVQPAAEKPPAKK